MTMFENPANDFVAVKRCTLFAEDVGDDVRDGALAIAPLAESVYAAADEDEALVFDEFVVNGLGSDVFAFEIRGFDCV